MYIIYDLKLDIPVSIRPNCIYSWQSCTKLSHTHECKTTFCSK